MIRPKQIWLAMEPVDMRFGMNSLSQLVQDSLGEPACGGRAYGFTNRIHKRLKLLVWGGAGKSGGKTQ
jgi:transposase